MNSINLLPKPQQAAGTLSSVRKWGVTLTTIVLIVYLVGAAGVVGWWLFLAAQDNLTAQRIAKLETEIRQNAGKEAVVWETGKRVDLIQNFLQSRVSLGSQIAVLVPIENVAVTGYKYSPPAQTIDVSVSQLEELEKYTERLKPKFPNIINTTIESENGVGWKAAVKL